MSKGFRVKATDKSGDAVWVTPAFNGIHTIGTIILAGTFATEDEARAAIANIEGSRLRDDGFTYELVPID
jgi:hypothetical protein